jgi:diguanylate cyclase (GGDEF)-like protein
MEGWHRPARRSGRWLAAWLGLAWGLLCPSLHAATPLNGAWREAQPGDTAQRVLQDYRHGDLHSFDPAQLQHFPLRGLGAWVVLQAQAPGTVAGRVLAIDPPPPGRVAIYNSDGTAVPLALDDFTAPSHAHGRLAWSLGGDARGGGLVLLKFEPGVAAVAPVSFTLLDADEYLRQDALWLTFASACFAVMLAMALMALCIAPMLRDITFAWYAGFVFCYAFIQGIRSGFLFHPLEMAWLAGLSPLATAVAIGLSMAFAALFAVRFCDLRRYAPLLRPPAVALAVGMLLVVLLRLCGIEPLQNVGQLLIDPLLILGSLLLGIAALVAAVRGSRHAWFFLLGWMPLLALTALWNAEISGTVTGVRWLGNASLAVGALETLVLSLGLADHALNMRRTHASVQVLANHDALTNVLNRRAWRECVEEVLGEHLGRPMALLFLDLDHFKVLNDRQGHAAGDRALVAVADALRHELRPLDRLGRYGGEEFVALLHDTPQDQATQVAIRLCRRVHRLEIPLDSEGGRLSISIGLAMYQAGDTLDEWIERADQAMYTAKLDGRNRVHASVVRRTATRGRQALKVVE